MKAPLHHIASRLYGEPWLIRRDKYNALVTQYQRHAESRTPLLRITSNRAPDNIAMVPSRESTKACLDGLEMQNGIAIVPVDGILGKNISMMESLCGGYDINTLANQAIALRARSDIHSVILHLNTPGGAAAGVADCAKVVMELGEEKRVIAYADDACSGGYWLACAASEIFCGESAMVGSISAICAIDDVTAMYEQAGIKTEVFTDGILKGAGVPGTSLSDEQREDIQSRIQHIGGMFKAYVTKRRPQVAKESMQGQWFYGDAALANGLVDDLAPSLEHVIAYVMATTAD